MRIFKFLLGVAVIAVALWVIIGEQITGVSSNAVVNARLTTLRAPISGQLDMPFRSFGDEISDGEILATLADTRADAVRLHDLQMELAFSNAQIAALTASIAAAEEEITLLTTRVDDYRAARADEFDQLIVRAGERVALLGGEPDAVTAPAGTTALSVAKEIYATRQIAGAAQDNDVFLSDGYNDASAAEIRLLDRIASRASLAVALGEAEARSAAIAQRLAQETERVSLLSSATLSAPDNGVIWEILADNGEIVQRGQDILRLMKCESALVTLSVPDNIYNNLSVGQPAKFRLDGTNTLYDGTITRIAGSGAETIYQNLAVAPSEKHLEQYDIALLVPALREEAGLRCTVGQTGRVFFEARPLDRLRDMLN